MTPMINIAEKTENRIKKNKYMRGTRRGLHPPRGNHKAVGVLRNTGMILCPLPTLPGKSETLSSHRNAKNCFFLTLMSMLNFMISCVEHENSFITWVSGQGFRWCHFVLGNKLKLKKKTFCVIFITR